LAWRSREESTDQPERGLQRYPDDLAADFLGREYLRYEFQIADRLPDRKAQLMSKD
jgi:hypothetical protein